MIQAAHIYIHYPDASAVSCHYPPGGQPRDVGYLIVSLVSMAVPRLFIITCVYALYPLTEPKSVWVASCKRAMSIYCLWRNSVSIHILIIADPINVYGRYFISVGQ
jgi:hypothetical protein